MFVWTEKELDPEQSDAVLTAGSVLLTACPGSGKTRALTYKAAHELAQLESDRKFVVAITYTHRAADEVQDRIESLGVDTSQLWIGTIHAFCLEWILKPYSIYEPALKYGYRIIDKHEKDSLIDDLCAPFKAPKINHFDCEYYFAHDGYHRQCPDPSKYDAIDSVLAQYFDILTEKRQLDFEWILWYAWKLVERLPEISKVLSHLFPAILVDEYQDTKAIQYSIIASIVRAAEGDTRLFMVGDPNQSIFGSFGGYPMSLADLQRSTGIPITPKALTRNYRSSSRIVGYFGNFNVYNTQIVAYGEHVNHPSRISYNHRLGKDELIQEIARLIRHSVEVLGIPRYEVCVLAPQWPHLAQITRGLAALMPDYEFDGPGMLPFAHDVENSWYKISRLALSEPSPQMYMRRTRWAEDTLSDLRSLGIDVSRLNAKSVLRALNQISIDEQDGLAFLRLYFEAAAVALGIPLMDFVQFQEHHAAFFESSGRRLDRMRNDGVAGITERSFFQRAFQNRAGITVSSIHGVKGAEYDVVIAFALLEGMLPHFNEPDKPASARKLLYVAGSRARKHLHLFSENDRSRGRYGYYLPTEVLLAYQYQYDTV